MLPLLNEHLRRWQEAGLIDADTAGRIRDHEAEQAQAPAARLRWPILLALALGTFLVYGPLVMHLSEHAALWQLMLARSLRGFYLWTALLTVLGYARVYLDRPFRWLPHATEAVFPWYILHQSLIVVLVFWLAPKHLGPWREPALVLVGTVLGCALLHELLIRRVGLLRPLFGLKPAGQRSPAAAPATLRLREDTA